MQTIIEQSHRSEPRSKSRVEMDGLKPLLCYHCGSKCPANPEKIEGKPFCCPGCESVFQLLSRTDLTDFYELNHAAGTRVSATTRKDEFLYLDEPTVRQEVVDYSDASLTRVAFRLPSIHCVACVWLLENLFRLDPGIGRTEVNFALKELAISFDTSQVKLSEVVCLLASLGYPPDLKLSDLQVKPRASLSRRLWLQLGVAGFSFGNTMLFSISAYLGLDIFNGPDFKKLVGLLSLILAIPVVTYSAMDYWKSAWVCIKRRVLNIDVPIAAGIAALFFQSCFEVVTRRGDGYFDSLCGLLFFLLSGKLFQQKTFDRLAFDRDYKSFFPLSVSRICGVEETRVSISQLVVGDTVILRNGELIPADSLLVTGKGLIDYSFVTGEADPVEKLPSEYLHSGGRQIGGAIEVELVKGVSQSYLTTLWNQTAFSKPRSERYNEITNQYSKRFTRIIICVAVGSAIVWGFLDPWVSLKAFTSVLIVACPCALALAAPFALGTAQRVLGRNSVFLKNPYVLETLAKVDTIVFDKTGTLTGCGAGEVHWEGSPLNGAEREQVIRTLQNSTHPLAIRLCYYLDAASRMEPPRSFSETPGCGMEGNVDGHQVMIGSASWVKSRTTMALSPARLATTPIEREKGGSEVYVSLDGYERGHFILESALRPNTGLLLAELSKSHRIILLSGDNDRDRSRFTELFGPGAFVHFNQTPVAKLGFVAELQSQGRTVMMVGDGLNDSGALRQSDTGVAVVENMGSFSPASDVIMDASMVPQLAKVLQFSKASMRIVRAAFLISTLYNIVGISIAATGRLSPVVCAILMPLSSVSVVAFVCGMTSWLGARAGLKPNFVHTCARKAKQ